MPSSEDFSECTCVAGTVVGDVCARLTGSFESANAASELTMIASASAASTIAMRLYLLFSDTCCNRDIPSSGLTHECDESSTEDSQAE
jgi:hypothetical protein